MFSKQINLFYNTYLGVPSISRICSKSRAHHCCPTVHYAPLCTNRPKGRLVLKFQSEMRMTSSLLL